MFVICFKSVSTFVNVVFLFILLTSVDFSISIIHFCSKTYAIIMCGNKSWDISLQAY